MSARTIFNIIRTVVILFGIGVSALSTIMTYDAVSLNIGLKDVAGSVVFTVGLTTVDVKATINLEHRGILFSFLNMNVIVYIYSDAIGNNSPVAWDREIFTISPGEQKTLTFNFVISRAIFNSTTEWSIVIKVEGIMSLMNMNFVSFTLNYTEII